MTSPLDLLEIPELDARLDSVDDHLIRTCSVGSPEIATSSSRMVAAGGKRLRPALTVATANLDQVFNPQVVAAAAAVELVQVGSLVHDDIFDAALTRRGTPTINAVEGPDEALLAGTYLLARAAAEAALKLDPGSSVAHAVICIVNTAFDWDWSAAARECAIAARISPNKPFVLRAAAVQHMALGE